MNVLSTVILGVLVSAVGLILGFITQGIKADLREVEQRLDRRIDGLQVTVDGMRSDLTQVALAVGAKPRASNR